MFNNRAQNTAHTNNRTQEYNRLCVGVTMVVVTVVSILLVVFLRGDHTQDAVPAPTPAARRLLSVVHRTRDDTVRVGSAFTLNGLRNAYANEMRARGYARLSPHLATRFSHLAGGPKAAVVDVYRSSGHWIVLSVPSPSSARGWTHTAATRTGAVYAASDAHAVLLGEIQSALSAAALE